MLSGYRLMWLMVMFDLPVLTKPERSAATRFRQFLQDQGFERVQFSVYIRFCSGKEQVAAHTRRIEQALPPSGGVQLLSFTDKQYENAVSFRGRAKRPANKNPEQLLLF